MDDEELDYLLDAIEPEPISDPAIDLDPEPEPAIDLPRDRRDLELLAEFIERNPGVLTWRFDGLRGVQFRALRWLVPGSYLPERTAERRRLAELLDRHDDLRVLAAIVNADDPVEFMAENRYIDPYEAIDREPVGTVSYGWEDAGAGDDGPSAGDEAGPSFDDDDPFLSESEKEELLSGDRGRSSGDSGGPSFGGDGSSSGRDLDAFWERVTSVAGGVVCLVAVAALFVHGTVTFDDSPSLIPAVEVLASTAGTSLVLGGLVGFVYRATADDVHDDYRLDLATALFQIPLYGAVAVGLLRLLPAVFVRPTVALIFLAIVVISSALVVLVPAYAGVFVGSLGGALASTGTS